MKECYQCRGAVIKIVGPITINNIRLDDIPHEECQQCHEKYFDVKTATFMQRVGKYVKQERKKLFLEI